MLQRLFRSISWDATTYLTSGSCLVLAPHPDDETLGCGAITLRKRAAGIPVHVFFATDGDGSFPASTHYSAAELGAVRRKEAIEACRRLGVAEEDVSFLGLPDGKLTQNIDALVLAIQEEIAAFRPDHVMAPCWADSHPDHIALHRAATLVHKNNSSFQLFEYTVWFWRYRWWKPWLKLALQSIPAAFMGRRFDRPKVRPWAVSAGQFQAQKKEALAAHSSQFQKLSDEAEWPLLSEVDGGRFIDHLLTPVEFFFPHDT